MARGDGSHRQDCNEVGDLVAVGNEGATSHDDHADDTDQRKCDAVLEVPEDLG